MVKIRVLLADDQQLMREGLRVLLDLTPDIRVVGEAGDGAEAVERAQALRPEVVLMDVRMPGLDGVAATRRLHEASRRSAPPLVARHLSSPLWPAKSWPNSPA